MNSDNKQIRDVADVAARIMAGLPPIEEALHPNQQKIDVVDDDKIDGKDFAKLRAGKKPDVKKEEVEIEEASHQSKTTMKHIPNASPALKQAAKDIKPGVGVLVVAAVVFVEQAQRRIPVQYAKRMVGRQAYGGTSTYIPIKVNQAGVIPVIFASSLLYIPSLIVNFTNSQAAWAVWVSRNFVKGDHPIYVATYAALIIFFSYFYVAITFNTDDFADNIKNYG